MKSFIAQKKKACLTGEPALANGKLLFTATCRVCHEFHGGGQKVGPDLIGSGRSDLDAILANVIDSNQIIGNGYESQRSRLATHLQSRARQNQTHHHRRSR
ncbi:MAG: c-type cytochrome [Verrucomicrobia bacterium]|nr:c-type cytochrome [Verrucomicrobiota bacterium]